MPGERTNLLAAESKNAKTEKNRLRLIMQSGANDEDEEDFARKERSIDDELLRELGRRRSARNATATRHRTKERLHQDKGGGVGGCGGMNGVTETRRRPVSLHGAREEILFGNTASCTWRPASYLLARAHSAEPSSSPYKLTEPERINSGASSPIPESCIKNKQSYELEGSGTEDDSFASSSLLQKIPKTRDAWPVKQDIWNLSDSAGMSAEQIDPAMHSDPMSAMNFTMGSGANPASGIQGQHRLGAKLDVVYSLLSMLGSGEGREDMSTTLLSMSNSIDSCEVMRQSGCLPLLIQLIHAPGQNPEIRERASRALYNIVHARNDEKCNRREARVLRFLEQLRDYCQALRRSLETKHPLEDVERHPSATVAALMKLSFDENHRYVMCQLGGLHAVAELVEMDHTAHGSDSSDQNCITLRRYSGMALTNLTFGDSNNKALLCSFHEFMKALVFQLRSPSDDLRQVTASVLRNLSWRADSNSKQTLREVGAVIALMKAAMEGRKESTLKSILSALWNLSAHCSTNKMDICAVEGALSFLVDMLNYNAPSKTLSIVENAGGILRNVSSHIAVRDDYRAIVRERGCLQVLLRQLRSPSLTVVSNACGALWNLSARCPQDQLMLWDLGAVPMLRSLVHSKHKMISMGSSAALKNLLTARPNGSNIVHLDSTARGLGLPTLPSLSARRQKALEKEIDQNLAETCDNIEPSTSPVNKENKFTFKLDQTFLETSHKIGQCLQSKVHSSVVGQPGSSGLKLSGFTRSESRESMRSNTSSQSDTIFEKVNRQSRNGTSSDIQMNQQSTSMHSAVNYNNFGIVNNDPKGTTEKKYTLRYMNAIPERLKPGEPLPDFRGFKSTDSTTSWTTAPNQDTSCPKGLLHSSVEDNLSLSNSSDSSHSKIGVHLDSNSFNFSGTKTKSTSYNGLTNYNPPLKNLHKVVSPLEDPTHDLVKTNYEHHINNSAKYGGNSSDDDKQSSAYFTGTDHEQDSSKIYCPERTLKLGSFNSLRASSFNDDSRTKMHFKKVSKSKSSKHCSNNPTAEHDVKYDLYNLNSSPRTDSLQSITTSESTLTLEAGRSLDSDSAIFEEDHKLGGSSGVPSFSSLNEDESKTINEFKDIKVRGMQYEADTESFPDSTGNVSDRTDSDNGSCYLSRRIYSDQKLHSENNLVRYKTTTSLNDIEIEDTPILKDRVISVESLDQQQSQDDADLSEITYTNDYYTVQETYTLENGKQSDDKQTLIEDDDCSISQQCSTLTYVSIDDKDSSFFSPKKETESTENISETMHTAVNSNSESCESFNSFERSEQVLLELCINSGISQPSTLLSPESIEKLKSHTSKDDTDSSKQMVVSANSENIFNTASVEPKVKCHEEYRRQRDPDAMIASLDRLTATLVQQSEAMRERDISAMKASLLSDTWNEDSPNEVSFPSISISAPLVPSFNSDLPDDNASSITELAEDTCNSMIMTDSKIIETEAIKLAEAVRAEVNQISLTSIDIDAINPPSNMGSLISLTASVGGIADNADNSERGRQSDSLPPMQLSMRKKSLPIGVVARRALGHGQTRTASLENLLNEYNSGNISQLENVKPPSIMDELLDGGDMENSMLSVASITSEVADIKDNDSSLTSSDPVFDLIKPVANVLSMTCLRYSETMQGSGNNSLSECLENINPPSLFNEVMDESTVEVNSHCNDTLCLDVEFDSEDATNFVFDERIEEIANDTDDGVTPISSEYCSSVESTPKKSLFRNHPGHLTPKQKRQLTKERYKTYTIAAERVKKEQEDRKKQEQINGNCASNSVGKCSPFSKLTPKQRRKEDRARFQTQVLGTPIMNAVNVSNEILKDETVAVTTEKTPTQIPVKSGIPMLRKFGTVSKTPKINRNTNQENDELNRTRIFDNETTSEKYKKPQEVSSSNTIVEQNQVCLNLGSKNEATQLSDEKLSANFNEFQMKSESQTNIPNRVTTNLTNIYSEVTTHNYETFQIAKEDLLDNEDDLNDSQSESDGNSSEKEESLPSKNKGPRIVKPCGAGRDSSTESNSADKQEPAETPKGIRGRRKPLYSKASSRNSTPQCSPLKQAATVIPISRSNSSPLVRATRATTLRQNNSFQKTSTYAINGTSDKRATSANNLTKRSSIPQKSSSAIFATASKRLSDNSPKIESPVKPLERQGTFTKDEPEMENAPMVLPLTPCKGNLTKQLNFANKSSPKTSPIHGKLKTPLKTPQKLNSYQPKLTKTTSAEKIPIVTNIPTITKRSSTNLCGQVVKSPSNYQLGPTSESGIPRKISLGPRSNSNSSIVSTSSAQGTRNKTVKESTSKIASLWKKVEENKNKQRFEKPDSRQWIMPTCESNLLDSPREDKKQTCNLFRSSTFEGVAKDTGNSSQNLISNAGKLTTV